MARSAVAAVAALVVLAGCASNPPVSSVGPSVPPPSSSPAVATNVATPNATSSAATATAVPATAPLPATATPVAAPSPTTATATVEPQETFHGAVDLEELIPDTVGDITLEKMSLSGQQWFDSSTGGHPQATQMLSAFIASLGASVDDVSAAGGSGFSDSSDAYVYVTALRIAGADSAALLTGTTQFAVAVAPLSNSGISATATSLELGGKNVTLVTAVLGGTAIDESYYYGSGDVVFKVSGDSEDTVASALELLP